MSPRLDPLVSIRPSSEHPWWLSNPPEDEKLLEGWKAIPGIHYYGHEHAYRIPIDALSLASAVAEHQGYRVSYPFPGSPVAVPLGVNPTLRDYQRETVAQLMAHRRALVSFEMRLGKSAVPIEAARLLGLQRILVVCPAIARRNWVREFNRWWPKHPHAVDFEPGLDESFLTEFRTVLGGMIIAVNYERLDRIPQEGWDMVVVDESHRAKTRGTDRSNAVRKLCDANRAGILCFLTGTPISDRPKDLWNQLSCLWPKRFGSWGEFTARYCVRETNEAGYEEVKGLRAEYAHELRGRLVHCTKRVTKQDVAHLLPPVETIPHRIKGKNRKLRELWQRETFRWHEEHVSKALLQAGDDKINATIELAEEVLHQKDRLCILTDRIHTAVELTKHFGNKIHTTLITGEHVPNASDRDRMLEQAKGQERCLIVATMHSIAEGIDLSWCTTAILAELYWNPGRVTQVLSRFHSPVNNEPVTIYVVILEGTLDEKAAEVLLVKTNEQLQLINAGAADTQLQTVLAGAQMTREEFYNAVHDAAVSAVSVDPYA